MSDTAYKIKEYERRLEVMRAYANGAEIECKSTRLKDTWDLEEPEWEWEGFDYRIKPKPRDIWVNEYDCEDDRVHDSPESAKTYEAGAKRIAVHYREVIDE